MFETTNLNNDDLMGAESKDVDDQLDFTVLRYGSQISLRGKYGR